MSNSRAKPSKAELVTDPKTRAEQFEVQARKKQTLMETYISQGMSAVSEITTEIRDFNSLSESVKDFLIGAVGLSRKSLNHLASETVQQIIEDVLPIKEIHKVEYKELLLKRFLLTAGDALGGQMRNFVGQWGEDLFIEALISRLNAGKKQFHITKTSSGAIGRIATSEQDFYFKKKPKFLDKSVDLIVLMKDGQLNNPQDYLACGEIKGGIDPAGADEHWKTARSALERIRKAFSDLNLSAPYLCFIGAAIENAMAKELEDLMDIGELNRAANLYKSKQLYDLIDEILDIS